MRVAILDDYQDVVKTLDCFNLLDTFEVKVFNETYTDTKKLASKLFEFEVLVLIRERTIISEELLSKLPNLKVISQTGKVSNHIDVDLCSKYNVLVLEGIGSSIAPAELTWALIMAASRNISSYVSNLSLNNKWQYSGSLGLGRTLSGLTIGIWGYGKIGQKIAKYANAFDMNIFVWGSESSRELAKEHGFNTASSKEEFFTNSDIVTLHLRLNKVTQECVKKSDLKLMKKDSLFVNTSRSQLVQKDALYYELKNNPSKTAAVDVYDMEPAIYENEKLHSLENVLCSPHLGYVEKNSYELYFKIAFENIIEYFKKDMGI